MKEAFAQYLTVQKGYSPHTLIAYLGDLRALNTWVLEANGGTIFTLEGASHITHRQLRFWMAAEMASGRSPRSVARALATAKTYFRYLCEHHGLASNPAGRVRTPRFGKRLPEYLTEQHITLLLDEVPFPEGWVGARDRCLLEVLYGCGLRRSEAANLRLRDVNLYSQTLLAMGKGGKPRILPFGNHVAMAVRRWLDARQQQGFSADAGAFLFVRKQGLRLSPESIYALVRKYLISRSSVQRGPHVLRHTFATHLLNRGANLNDIKELLGHKSLAATQVYTHNSISQLSNIHKLAHPRASKQRGGTV